MAPGKHERNYDLYFHLFFTAAVFAIAFAWSYRKYLLNPINREVLLAWNLIFVYALMRMHVHPYISEVAAIIAFLLFVNLFFPFDLRKHMQTAMYAYFLCLVAGTAFLYLSLSNLTFFFTDGKGPLPDVASIFFAGSSLLYITVNLWYVYELNPLPGKHESWEHRMKIVRENAAMMEAEYDESFQPLTRELIATGAIATLLAGNFLANVASDGLIIPLAVTLCHFGKKPMILSEEPEASSVETRTIPDSPSETFERQLTSQTTQEPSSDTSQTQTQ